MRDIVRNAALALVLVSFVEVARLFILLVVISLQVISPADPSFLPKMVGIDTGFSLLSLLKLSKCLFLKTSCFVLQTHMMCVRIRT